MGAIVAWPRHILERHHDCDKEFGHCPICDGGLATCTVCGGFEGSLPTDCPGEKMPSELDMEVYGGFADYRFGRGWVQEPNDANAARFRRRRR